MSDSTLHPAHPDVELLADHAEELLPAEQSAELTAHLAVCAECRETYEALAELSALLRDEPAPGPMPEDVAARIDAALAAERETRPEADALAATGSHRDATDTDTALATTTGTDAGTAAEADTSATAGADAPEADDEPVEGVQDAQEGDGTRTAPSRRGASERPAGERPADNRPGSRSRRSVRVRRLLTTLALFVAAGGIGVAVSRGGDLDSGTNATSASGTSHSLAAPNAASPSAYDFTQANLASEIQRLANGSRQTAAATAGGAASGAPSPSASAPGGVGHDSPHAQTVPTEGALTASGPTQPIAPACVLAATKQVDPPTVQGLGHYLGVEVFALLYPDPADPEHRWDVYLVQDSCSAPLVMLHQSVPRT